MWITRGFVLAILVVCCILAPCVQGCKPAAQNAELPPEFDIVTQTWQLLKQDYIDKDKLDPKKLSQGAVRGMLESLDDPYSAYVEPEIRQLELSDFEGKFEGIGAEITLRDKQLMIVTPLSNSPAEKAGLKPGDKIVKINGEPTSKMSLVEATLKIRGPKGTAVNLTILREGDTEPFDVMIVRDEIKLESVVYEMRKDIGYVKITRFQKSTGKDLRNALKDIIGRGGQGIVLDLRNNPGGVLEAAVDVASEFLVMGTVAQVVDSEGKQSFIPVKPGGVGTKLHLIVLVNHGSASASEIVAGALQDYGRAKLAGNKTFGKGSVQMVRELKDGSALHITAYRWLTPHGRPIDGVGLSPDFTLDLEGEQLIDWAVDYLENLVKTDYRIDTYSLTKDRALFYSPHHVTSLSKGSRGLLNWFAGRSQSG